MKNMKKILALLLVLCLSFSLMSACSSTSDEQDVDVTDEPVIEDVLDEDVEEDLEDEVEETTQAESTIYIGQGDIYDEILYVHDPVDFSQENATEEYIYSLLSVMEFVTGWDLSCTVSAYKSISFGFSAESSVFVGAPDPQVDEYFAYDYYSLLDMIFDSIVKTVSENLSNGDADIEFYFSSDSDEELVFTELGVYVPLEYAYDGLVSIE